VTEPLVPARLAFAPDGTPFSELYHDVYHSAAGGAAQARHVFLRGNGLPERWRRRRAFTILETGFGFGLSFLAAWQAWREDAARCARLHFVSVEKHPFTAQDLAVLHAPHQEFAPLAAELREAWPMLVPGMHRLEFEQGALVLTLAFGDAADALGQLRLAADALFLDGFAPARNPGMWSREVMRQLSRLAAPGATAATWSVAAQVRDGLRSAGLVAEKRRGFAAKSEMLVAELAPRRVRAAAGQPAAGERRALVIGAGLAGAAACERLAARGWEIVLAERHDAPAAEASGNHAGTFHPVVSPDDSVFARVTRAAFLYWLGRWRALDAVGAAPEWARCGVLQLARDDEEEAAQRAALEQHRYPADYAQYLTRAKATACAGMKVAAGGVWFPEAGWMRPPSLVRALLARCGARLQARYGVEAASLERSAGAWRACNRQGATIAEAPVAILANSADALRLAPQKSLRLRRVRGQLTVIPGARLAKLRAVLLRGGFVLPPVDGIALAGASYDPEDEDPAPRAESHAGNLERLERILPGAAAGLDPARLQGRVAFRAVARDRLPLIGALADESAAPRRKDPRLADLPPLEGLHGAFAFGSRGLLWAGLGAELLASALEGEPLPLEGQLADALDPARFLLRYQRSRRMSS